MSFMTRLRWRRINRRITVVRRDGRVEPIGECMCGEPAAYVSFVGPLAVAWCAVHRGVYDWQQDGDGPWEPL